jgi:hypothetical protein
MIQRQVVTASIGVLATALLFPGAAGAGQGAVGSGDSVLSSTSVLQSPTVADPIRSVSVPATPFQPQTSAEKQMWVQSLAQAEARHRRSTWILGGAAGAIGLGVLYQARERETGYTYITDTGVGTATLLYFIGGGLGVYGYVERTRSRREIDELQAEGRRRGFTTSISPTGLRAGYTLAF